MLVIAHRGASAVAPENTIVAFDAAIEARADAIETDVRLTADGCAVLSHDDKTHGVKISSSLRDALPPSIASLDELLARVPPGFPLYLELKPWVADGEFRSADVVARAVAPMLQSRGALTISSFDPSAVAAARELVPQALTAIGVLEQTDPTWVIELANASGHQELHVPDTMATAALIERVHAAGLKIAVYTVNSPDRALELERAGADAVFTDDPAAIVWALAR